MYDPFKSLLCGISGSSPRHLWSMPFLSSQDMWYFWYFRHSNITFSLSPYL
jgi:hypothetical protein